MFTHSLVVADEAPAAIPLTVEEVADPVGSDGQGEPASAIDESSQSSISEAMPANHNVSTTTLLLRCYHLFYHLLILTFIEFFMAVY